jgi:hypothetical protein
VTSVVNDEQITRAVVVEEEIADVLVKLQLWPLANIELDGLGLVMEPIAENFFELDSLRRLISQGIFMKFWRDIPRLSS